MMLEPRNFLKNICVCHIDNYPCWTEVPKTSSRRAVHQKGISASGKFEIPEDTTVANEESAVQ